MHRNTQLGIAILLAATAVMAVAQQPPQGRPGPGGPPGFGGQPGFAPPPMMMGPGTPELAKKMAAIAALREIHNLRITAAEIGKAIPLLKELREAEKTLETQAGEALEQEKRALLAARPDTQVPPASGERMREAHDRFRQQTQRVWETLFKEIGPQMASGLQRILSGGMGFPPAWGPPGQPPAGFGGPGPGPGFNAGGIRPAIPSPGGDDPAGAPGRPGGAELGPAPGFPEGPAPGQRQNARGRGANRQNTPSPQGRTGAPNPGWQPVPGQPYPQGMGFGPSPRVSLAELIDLLEQKLAAMRS